MDTLKMAATDAGLVVEAEDSDSAVNWGAVIAGGIAAAALTLVLLAFGAGVGFSVVSPWSDQGVSAPTFSLAAGVYLIVVAMLASTVGGYLAGRLRTKWTGVHTHEVFFRDTAHGFLAWAFATVLSATVMGAAATHLLAGASAGLTQGAAGAATTQAANSSGGPTDIYVDTLFRPAATNSAGAAPAAPAAVDPATGAPVAGAAPAAVAAPRSSNSDPAADRAAVGRLFVRDLGKGQDFSAEDRVYLSQVVAQRTGMSQAEADKRVNDTITQAKQATDTARKAAAKLSLWLAASMLIGAFAASLAATEGGKLRDGDWGSERMS
jgi:hypothetical protein